MTVQENVLLAPFTTFNIGGPAQVFLSADTIAEAASAIQVARERQLPLRILGGGSNVLIPDEGVEEAVFRLTASGISFEGQGSDVWCIAEAGASWDGVVRAAAQQGLWGIENLAGIPGTVAGAAVQNIGAYGAELSSVFISAEVIDLAEGRARTVSAADAAFGYRTSFFKAHPELLITRIGLRLAKQGVPVLTYADLARRASEGAALTTPAEIAEAVRAIRARKFPDLSKEGTAGSFFKNPVIASEAAAALAERFPGLPAYPQADDRAKVSLAWILDHALSLKGFSVGGARLYENQPLVIAARAGARAADVRALAEVVEQRVYDATGITIEREVETFTARV